MGKQIVKVFYCGKYLDYPLITETIENQMNRYLEENPLHRFVSISTIIGTQYKEAFVVIDTGEPTAEQRSGYISDNVTLPVSSLKGNEKYAPKYNDPESITTVAATGSDTYRYEKKNKNQNQNQSHSQNKHH